MLRYTNLKFFNKKGTPINLAYDEAKQVWTGNIHLQPVSAYLFENETIYIVEELENVSNDVIYGVPHTAEGLSDTQIEVSWIDKEDSINLYSIVNPLEPKPTISIEESVFLAFIDSSGDTINNTTGRFVTSVDNPKALRINVCINFQEEGNYERNLLISDANGDIAIINVYGEVVGQDERFNNWLAVFGQPIADSNFYIFKDSDINEPLIDYKLLNTKRKELLHEYKNIFPYIGGYKGLLNIIKFFGYYDLRLKEYWLNTETGKYLQEEVKLYQTENLDKKQITNLKPWEKTSKFALFYDIIRDSPGKFDANGMPITEKAFMYTNEEILIKLYGLKNYIENNDITGMSTIVDIVGESVIYKRYGLVNWNDKATVINVDSGQFPTFEIDQTFGYIYDLRNDLPQDTCEAPRDWSAAVYPDLQITDHRTCYIGYFSPYNRDIVNFVDEPNIPVGFKIKLTNTTFDVPWTQAGFSWLSTVYQNIVITWANIGSLNITEIGWTVKYVSELANVDGRRFTFVKIGKKDDLKNIDIILPFDGEYDITLTVYGYNGEITSHTERKAVKLAMKNADATAFYRFLDSPLQKWATNNLKWKDINSQWKRPIYDNRNYSIDDVKVSYRSFKMVEWLELYNTDNPYLNISPPKWNRDDIATWNDFKYITWNQLIFKREKLAKFTIDRIKAGGVVQIGHDVFQMPSDINLSDFKRVADLLAAETGVDISSFSYIARPIDAPSFIDCVSKFDDDFGDKFIGSRDGVVVTGDIPFDKWKDFDIAWKDEYLQWSMVYKYFVKSISNPFTMDDIRIYGTAFKVPTMVPIFFVYDNSAVAGKTKAIWTIYDSFDNIIIQLEHKNISYTFLSPGFYTLEIDITDSNGNRAINRKENFIEVMPHDKFRLNA